MTPSANDPFVLPASATVRVANKLLDTLNTMLGHLPEPELLVIHSDLENSLQLADSLLGDTKLASTLGSFSISNDTAVSRSESSVSVTSTCTADPDPARQATTRTTVPTTPISSPINARVSQYAASSGANGETPRTIITVGGREIILSVRPNVGIPDYSNHPLFVKPGIPGPYKRPPIGEADETPSLWYVVTKGLYVGIFTSWNETSSYVQGVSRNAHGSTSRWEEAKNRYNSTLKADACQVLS